MAITPPSAGMFAPKASNLPTSQHDIRVMFQREHDNTQTPQCGSHVTAWNAIAAPPCLHPGREGEDCHHVDEGSMSLQPTRSCGSDMSDLARDDVGLAIAPLSTILNYLATPSTPLLIFQPNRPPQGPLSRSLRLTGGRRLISSPAVWQYAMVRGRATSLEKQVAIPLTKWPVYSSNRGTTSDGQSGIHLGEGDMRQSWLLHRLLSLPLGRGP